MLGIAAFDESAPANVSFEHFGFTPERDAVSARYLQLMQGFELVVYDLDGTLIETAPEICDAVNDVMHHHGWPEVDEHQVTNWIGHGTGELLLKAVSETTGTEPDSLRHSGRMAEIARVYDTCYAQRCGTRSRLYPHVRETLAAFRVQGMRAIIATNKERRYTDKILAAHRLAENFHRVLCGDTMPAPKPDPTGLLDCLRELGVCGERALFVGDSSIDVATARKAGMPVWLLPDGYNMDRPIQEAQPDRIVRDFGELRHALTTGGPAQRGRKAG